MRFLPWRLSLCLGILVICLGGRATFGAEYAIRDFKIRSPRLKGTLGKKMTASGGVVMTSRDMVLHAATVTWYFDAAGKRIDRLEASEKVRFQATEVDKEGSKIAAEGEGDFLVYLVQDGKATVSSTAKAARKAHVHAVETAPAAPAAAQPKTYDIRAFTITLNLRARTFEASGEVELLVLSGAEGEANLPEEKPKETTDEHR